MDRQQPSGVLPRRPFIRFIKLNLAIGFLFLILFSGYQPQLTYPPLKKNIVVAQEQEQTKTIQASSTTLAFQTPHPGYLSTRFSSYHPGIDLATGLGMPVKPISKGTVISAGLNFWGLGLVVEVDHGEGYRSLYAHMGRTFVKPGQHVDNTSTLGEVGMTGNTTGPHTHLEIYKDGKVIDPSIILPPLRNQPQESDFIAKGGSYNTQTQQLQQVQKKPVTTPSPIATPKNNPTEKKELPLELNLIPTIKTTSQISQLAPLTTSK